MRTTITPLWVFYGLAVGVPLASAQPSPDGATAALALGREGLAALEKKDYAAAADLFARAEARYHAPTLMLGLARAQVGLGKLVAAREIYDRIVREGAPRGAPPALASALDDAKKELAALEARLPSVIMTVSGPAAPVVTLDGVPVPMEALGQRQFVDPGEHTVQASADGYVARELKLTVHEGDAAAAPLHLLPEPPASPAERARPLQPPSAGEGSGVGERSGAGSGARAGSGADPLRQGGARPEEGSQRDGSLRVQQHLQARSGPLAEEGPQRDGSLWEALGQISLGAGIGALGMGAGMVAVALADDADLQERCPAGRCSSSDELSRIEGYDRMRALAIGSLAGGGVCAGAGVTLLLTSDTDPAPLQRTLGRGLVGAGASGLALGAVAGVLSLAVNADLDGCSEESCPAAQQGDRESASSLRTLSILGLGAGAVSLGAGIALWATAPSARGGAVGVPASAGAIELTPYVGPWGGGVAGRF